MPSHQRVEGGRCPVADAKRPLIRRGETDTISGYDICEWKCRVCGAIVHEPVSDAAPFGRHRQVDCPIECLGAGNR